LPHPPNAKSIEVVPLAALYTFCALTISTLLLILSLSYFTCKSFFVGASNGDIKEYYEIFEAAFIRAGAVASNLMHIKTNVTQNQLDHLKRSNVILLAGIVNFFNMFVFYFSPICLFLKLH